MRIPLGVALALSLLLNLLLLWTHRPRGPERTASSGRASCSHPLPTPQPAEAAAPVLSSAPSPASDASPGPRANPSPPAPEPPPIVTLHAHPAHVPSRGEITALRSLLSGKLSPKDWIGLFPEGGGDSSRVAWKYAPSGDTALAFTAPPKPGRYEFRYFPADGSPSVASSPAVTVFDSGTRPFVALRVDSPQVRAGGPVHVEWTGLSGRALPADWVGIFAEGSDNRAFGPWAYVQGETGGRLTLTAPKAPGVYEVRYLLDDGYDAVAVSGRLVVLD